MPKLKENQRIHVLGMVQVVMAKNVFQNKLVFTKVLFDYYGNVSNNKKNTVNRPRPRRTRLTSNCQYNHIRFVHFRNRFQTASLTLAAPQVLDA